MITLLAPSKTMDFNANPQVSFAVTQPHFLKEAFLVVQAIRGIDDIVGLMKVSQDIAARTRTVYENWGKQTAPTIYTYKGDVYKGFFANTLTGDDLIWAQAHIRILSGVYGVLRPLDAISAYRLEMKAKLVVGRADNLYSFWGDKLAKNIDEEADGVICVLSSDEYAKVVTAYTTCRIVTPVFLDKKPNGKIGTVPIYSKMMRGVMARWIINHRVYIPERLKEFSMYGYSYDAGNKYG